MEFGSLCRATVISQGAKVAGFILAQFALIHGHVGFGFEHESLRRVLLLNVFEDWKRAGRGMEGVGNGILIWPCNDGHGEVAAFLDEVLKRGYQC